MSPLPKCPARDRHAEAVLWGLLVQMLKTRLAETSAQSLGKSFVSRREKCTVAPSGDQSSAPPPRGLLDVQPVACKGMWAKSSSAWSREEWPGCDSVTRRLGKATPRLGPAVTVELKGRAGSQTRGRLFLFKKLA